MKKQRGWVCLRTAGAALALALWPAHGLAQPPFEPWKVMAPAPAGEEEVYGTEVGGKIYVMGGIKPLWRPLGFLLEYDPQANKWVTKQTMPPLIHHVGVASLGGKLYLIGGFAYPEEGPPAWTPVADAWEYDPKTDSWKKLAPLPTPRGSVACAALAGKVHCVGGVRLPAWSKLKGIRPGSEIENLSDHIVYDPATNSWSTKAPMITPRNHVTLTAVGGKLYAIGGRIGHGFVGIWSVPSNANDEYDPAADRWLPRTPLPTPRSSHSAVVVEGKIHVLGGEVYEAGVNIAAIHRTHEVYNPQTNRWTASIPLRTPRHGFVAAAVGNRIFAISGANVPGGAGPHVALTVNEMLEVE